MSNTNLLAKSTYKPGFRTCCPITPKIIRVVEESHFKSFPGVASLTAFHYDAVLGNQDILNRGAYENRQ